MPWNYYHMRSISACPCLGAAFGRLWMSLVQLPPWRKVLLLANAVPKLCNTLETEV